MEVLVAVVAAIAVVGLIAWRLRKPKDTGRIPSGGRSGPTDRPK